MQEFEHAGIRTCRNSNMQEFGNVAIYVILLNKKTHFNSKIKRK